MRVFPEQPRRAVPHGAGEPGVPARRLRILLRGRPESKAAVREARLPLGARGRCERRPPPPGAPQAPRRLRRPRIEGANASRHVYRHFFRARLSARGPHAQSSDPRRQPRRATAQKIYCLTLRQTVVRGRRPRARHVRESRLASCVQPCQARSDAPPALRAEEQRARERDQPHQDVSRLVRGPPGVRLAPCEVQGPFATYGERGSGRSSS